MSKSMVSKYISKKWDEISKDTTEYKAYNLGLAIAYHQFYDFYKNHLGKKDADVFMKNFIGSGGVKELYRIILNDLIELTNKEPETNAEKIAEKMFECKNN